MTVARIGITITLAFGMSPALAEVANWDFVESVGGLSIGVPTKSTSGWALPVVADVSGLSKVTAQPKQLNSGIACVATLAVVERSSIFLSVVTGIGGAGRNAQCPAADLGQIASGKYSVKYRGSGKSEIALGNVVIAP